MKRVVDYQIKCCPFANFARFRQVDETIIVLTNVVNGRAGIESAEIIKQARIPAVSRERAESDSYEVVVEISFGVHRTVLPNKSSQVVAAESEGECPEIAVTENRGIELIVSLVIQTFGDISR